MKKLLIPIICLLFLSACAPASVPADAPVSAAPQTEATTETPQPTVSHLMVAGDIMSHLPQVEDAYVAETDTYNYDHMFAEAAPLLQSADFAVGNLETVLGGGPAYSGFPNFSSPDALAEGAKNAGLDLLSTANNHTKDQGTQGIFRTIDVLDSLGLQHVGTYRSEAQRNENRGIAVADVGGISVAFLSYTYGLNGYALNDDEKFAVNIFNLDYTTTLSEFDYDLVSADMAAARALGTDMIAVMMHWGVEYTNTPGDYQKETAKYLFEQGADLVLGGHPHVLQPYETVTVTDVDGNEKQGFVIYSLGNFMSCQNIDPSTRTTAVLDLELTKTPAGETTLTDVSYTPFYMVKREDLPAGQRRRLVDLHAAIDAYENGTTDLITPGIYDSLLSALRHCHEVLGEEGDAKAK
ncbi:MAG: CapA family protein [Clostridia bacterium]|nr:CapA family protein [Clostridia bacterium]